MDSPYTSLNLWHFVGWTAPNDDDKNYATLKKVLASGCVSHAPHEYGQGTSNYTYNLEGTFRDGRLIVPTVTCYADIPESSLGVHVRKYGRFGIGFRRRLLVARGTRPVTYVPIGDGDGPMAGSSANTLKDIEAVYRGFRRLFDQRDDVPKSRRMCEEPKTEGELYGALKYVLELEFLPFIKVFHSELRDDDPSNFYMEREWRKYGNLLFEPRDISAVCVAASHVEMFKCDFPALIDRMKPIPS